MQRRESKLSWLDLLRDLKARGLPNGPALPVGDGALGFWAAMAKEYPQTREQRCWVHKTANVEHNASYGVHNAKYARHLLKAAEDKVKAEMAP